MDLKLDPTIKIDNTNVVKETPKPLNLELLKETKYAYYGYKNDFTTIAPETKKTATNNVAGNISFIDSENDLKTIKVGSDTNNFSMKIDKGDETKESSIKDATLNVKADHISFFGNISEENGKPVAKLSAETNLNGVKFSSNIENPDNKTKGSIKAELSPYKDVTLKTEGKIDDGKASGSLSADIIPYKDVTLQTEGKIDDGKASGSIKTSIKATENLSITTEGQLDSNKKTKLGTSAKLKVTDSTSAETIVNYDDGKTQAKLKSETDFSYGLKLVTELEHENTDSFKTGTNKAGIRTEYSPYKNFTISSGTTISQEGKIAGTLRGEASINSVKISTGFESTGKMGQNKYDAKISGEVFKGLSLDTGLEIDQNKTNFKAGISYSAFNDAVRVKADTTGTDYAVKLEAGFKF